MASISIWKKETHFSTINRISKEKAKLLLALNFSVGKFTTPSGATLYGVEWEDG
jgi:hypothetical protein